MKTVKELIKELSKYPQDAKCSAYEGEACGINIMWIDNGRKSGFIECSEQKETPKRSDRVYIQYKHINYKTCDNCASKPYCGSIPIERDFPNCWNADEETNKP